MSEPLVSICIPAYKKPEFITRCLNSIITQDYKNVEIIISDDSPDQTIKAVSDKFSKDLNIRYFHNSVPLKTPANWNNAIDKGNGAYYLLMHQDDWFASPEALGEYISAMGFTGADFIFGQNMGEDEEGNKVVFQNADVLPDLYSSPGYLMVRNVVGPPSNVMVKRSIAERYGDGLIWLVDIEFYMRLLSKGFKYSYVNKHLVNIGLHKDQTTVFVRENNAIILKENIIVSNSLDKNDLNNVKIYDHFWRLARNHRIRELKNIADAGLDPDEVPLFFRNIVQFQRKFPLKILQIGLFSKSLMLLSLLRNRLISQ
jgi:glycosyltransferase involved in cell wall biosynthesis